ncbi:MAG: hypothetical protein K9N23_04880 [Akkermansiaceae bacterium]|nr:hypothetical protein [Akkermansiaceae bacterium]
MKPLKTAVLLLMSAIPAFSGPRDAQWSQVRKHIDKDLPKSAIEVLTAIDQQARAEQAWPEAIRATAQRIRLAGAINEGRDEIGPIKGLEVELATVPAPMKPLLQTIQALWIWDYFYQNRWQFMQRTQTAAVPSADIQTWDLKRVLTEVDSRFQLAMTERDALRAIPIADYDFIIKKGTAPDSLRPTLYDFVAHEYLRYFAARDQVNAAAEDEFTFDGSSPAFGTTAEFLTWQPATTDEESPRLKTVLLYQELLSFHQQDLDARIHLDLLRLAWAKEALSGDAPTPRLEERLREIIQQTEGNELQSLARANLAQLMIGQNKLVEARKIAIAGRDAFKESRFRDLCITIIEGIERKELTLSTELVWNAAKPQFDVRYRNLGQIHFRLYPVTWSPENESSRNDDWMRALLARKPAKEWSVDVEPTPDFQQKTRTLDAPLDLPKGCYELVVSPVKRFPLRKNQLSYTRVWLSELAVTTRVDNSTGGGWVTHALTGKPVNGAKVEVWNYINNKERWTLKQTLTTDGDGRFSTPPEGNRTPVFRARHGDDSLATGSTYHYNQQEQLFTDTVYLFTDRALYRPGQTVRFKGIAAHYDRRDNDYHTRNNQDFEVRFVDQNRKEITKLNVKSNEFGSFSGSFTAPTDRVLGQAFLQCEKSSQTLRIEEYKRPKFYAEVGPAKAQPKLGEKVTVTAKAEAYTGAAIDGAKVKWSVTRQTLWPDWCRWCWWFVPRDSGSKQIAHGEGLTKADGSFEVEFLAEPDADVDPAGEPVFSYQVNFEVTDTTGETRTAQRAVKAGYVGVQASLTADAWQETAKPVELTVATKTVDDEPLAAKGTVTVHRLVQPAAVLRTKLGSAWGRYHGDAAKPEKDPADPNSWELGEVVQQSDFATNDKGKGELEVKLEPGEYRAVLATTDAAGKKVTALLPLRVVDPEAKAFPVRITNHFAAKTTTVLPGEEFIALWGTGYPDGQMWFEVEHRGKLVKSGWSGGTKTQEILRFPVTEAHRGGFTVRALFVHQNRTYTQTMRVDVPWNQHDLALKFETMRSKLEPGSKETWSVVINGAKGNAVEMLGTLYDASLDAFASHRWLQSLSGQFYHDSSHVRLQDVGGPTGFRQLDNNWNHYTSFRQPLYRHWTEDLCNRGFSGYADTTVWGDADGENASFSVGGGGFGGMPMRQMLSKGAPMAMAGAMAMEADAAYAEDASPVPMAPAGLRSGDGAVNRNSIDAILNGPEPAPAAPGPDLGAVTARKNLQETAFFEPHLTTDEQGIVRMTFTMPEALTKWRFMGFAHDAALRSGYLEGETVTAKDLMVQPNPPRFLREGDEIEFTAKVSNQSDQAQTGKARLNFADAATLESRDAPLGLTTPEQAFEIPAKESKTLSWRIKVPDGAGFLTFKAVAATGNIADGEEGMIAVLSKRQLVTESITLPIRNAGSREFEMKKLLDSGASDTLRNESLTLQVVSQPAWYAVMALPYLMEYPHECAEQTFNRYYANQLARHIVQSDPKIRRVFELWRTAPQTLESPLLKNQDLKSLMIEDTPWLRDANSETEARRNVGVLFDDNRLDSEMARASKRLRELQLQSGAWPWFPGGKGSEFITLYIVTGSGRLKHLGAPVDQILALRALDWLDNQIRIGYEDIKPKDRKNNHFSPHIAMYLYGRSFFLKERPVAANNREAIDYYLGQGAKYWVDNSGLMTRCHTAVGLLRFGDRKTPAAIVKSLQENALNTEELGMHWRMNAGYYWHQAPIETQAMIIETFREVAKDMQAVDDCQVWLLKQKQTQGWKTTKSTADAVYALLLGGDVKRLASDALVTAELGGVAVKPENVEPGTGFYQKKFHAAEIKPEMGRIKLTKTDAGVSWGSLHWQYLEDVAKITPHEGTPLEVKKSLWVKRMTKEGAALEPVTGPLVPGDEIVTRIEIRVDRDMEYIHLKNQRGSGVEPVNVLSNYKWQDGLGYYEMTKDTADHFFIDWLPRGTYVFESAARVQLRGIYPTGIAEIQCMYAPEFNSHSGSVNMEVK